MRLIASERVAAFDCREPRTALVTVSAFGDFTPRIAMHRCSA